MTFVMQHPGTGYSNGVLKTFGKYGPVYEILGEPRRSPSGEEDVRVRVFHTGEVLDYGYLEMLTDPEADVV
jgi:hypothetical protein